MADGFLTRCGGRRRRPALAIAGVLLAAAGLSACEGKNPPPAPQSGQAVLLPPFSPDSRAGQALAALGTSLQGFSTAANGDSYLLSYPTLVRLRTDGKAVDVPAVDGEYVGSSPTGVVAMPDGSLLIGHNGELVRYSKGPRSVLAGTAYAHRPLDDPAPARATATSVHFTQVVAPLGVTRSGTVMIADGRALWSLNSGQMTRVYQRPAASPGKDYTILDYGDAVAPDGTTYLQPAFSSPHTLADVQVVSPDGKVAPLKLPTALPGVAGPLATLTPAWMASDGADGLYIHALRLGHDNGDYVLHLRDGNATLVAVGKISDKVPVGASCPISKPVDAKQFPCPLPTALGYHSGRLTLAGEQPYAVEVLVSKPSPGAAGR